MEKYCFVYSVDAVTVSGHLDMYGMILDRSEFRDTIRDIRSRNGRIIGIEVSMYDSHGVSVSHRDITHMFVPSH